MMQKKNDLRMLSCVKVGLSWLLGYCGTFLYKWFLSTIFLGDNYFKIAYEKFASHTNVFGRLNSLKLNLNTLCFNKLSLNLNFSIFIVMFLVLLLFIYIYRKKDMEKYIISLFITAIIPYVRYLVLPGHSFGFAFFTYRAQLVLFIILLLLLNTIDINLIFKGVNKKNGQK